VRDLSPLAGLTNLTQVSLSYNQISDLTPLANLTNLSVLTLGNNQIVVLTPLMNLINLSYLSLQYNQIVDLSALVSNTGIGSGDILYIWNNPLDCASQSTNVRTLVERGVQYTGNCSSP
jgi:Leucine-rich repeat (LRR) protein